MTDILKAARVAKFNSIGSAADQQTNRTRVVQIIGTIPDEWLSDLDRMFVKDCRIKLNQAGGSAMFGWRQMSKLEQLMAAWESWQALGIGERGGNGRSGA